MGTRAPFRGMLSWITYQVIAFAFRLGAFLKRFKIMHSLLMQTFDLLSGSNLSPVMYWRSLFGPEMLENVWRSIAIDLNKKAKLGEKAYNSPVVALQDCAFHRLLDFARGTRPLVVNFGSCTCPIFMDKLNEYKDLISRFNDVADFVLVYIEEAHPIDGWAFDDNNNNISSHRTQKERCLAANVLSTHNAPCPVLVDSMLDAANIAYGAMPIRLYVIQHGHVVYQGGAGPVGYSMRDLSEWLSTSTSYKR